MKLRWEVPLRELPYLLGGAFLTLRIVGVAVLFGIILGILAAMGRTSKNKLAYSLASAYVEFFRNTPLLAQIFFAYFGLPSLGIDLSPNQAALSVIILNTGAYMTEIIRAGLESVHKSQIESGWSLGMTYLQVFRYVILPPAMKAIAPPLSNQIISITLSSCVISQISAEDLTFRAMILENRTFRSFEIYIVTILIYFLMAQMLHLLFRWLNKRLFGITERKRLTTVI